MGYALDCLADGPARLTGYNPKPRIFRKHYAGATSIGACEMTKLEQLKIALIEFNRSKSIAKATSICKWLHEELIKEPKKIEVKEG